MGVPNTNDTLKPLSAKLTFMNDSHPKRWDIWPSKSWSSLKIPREAMKSSGIASSRPEEKETYLPGRSSGNWKESIDVTNISAASDLLFTPKRVLLWSKWGFIKEALPHEIISVTISMKMARAPVKLIYFAKHSSKKLRRDNNERKQKRDGRHSAIIHSGWK